MSRGLVAVAVLLAAAGGCASSSRELVRANERLYHAIGAHDTATLETLLAPDFHFRAATGEAGDRAAFLAGVAAERAITVQWIDNDRLRIEPHGEWAILCGRQRAVLVADGKRVHDESHFCDRWDRRAGRWHVTFAGP